MGDETSRIKTGIVGLDSILFGGIPAENQIIIAGGPGAGKTLLSFEILYRNAKNGVPVAFITFDEHPSKVLENAKKTFAEFTDLDELIKKNMFVIEGKEPASDVFSQAYPDDYSFGNMVSYIEGVVKTNGAKVMAIDSLSLIKLMMTNKLSWRRSMVALISNLRRLGVTAILTSDIMSSERDELRFSQEFFIFDGVIMLYQSGQEDKRVLTMEVVKMRGSNHSWALSPYEITPHGFKIFTIEQ